MTTVHTRPAVESESGFRPTPGGYPAGKVIAVVLLALLLGALFDADSLYASVSSERFGSARTAELDIIRPVRVVSDTLGLNLPHRWLADIAGTNQSHPGDLLSLEASGQTGAITSLLDPIDSLRLLRGGRVTATHTSRPAPPRPRLVTAASPLKVWIAGDSLIGALSDAFVAHVAGNSAVPTATDVQIGTGLARPDVYDWPAAIAQEMQKQDPNLVILTFGANDAQDMVAGSTYLVRDSPAWQAEYTRRVALVMSEVATSGRMLIWVGIPPVARPRLQATAQIINRIVKTEARLYPGVVVVDPTPAVTVNGSFTDYLPGSSGGQIQVRTPDGIHLTPAGAGRVLPLVLAAVRKEWAIP